MDDPNAPITILFDLVMVDLQNRDLLSDPKRKQLPANIEELLARMQEIRSDAERQIDPAIILAAGLADKDKEMTFFKIQVYKVFCANNVFA